MLSIKLKDSTEQRLARLARETGKTKAFLAIQLIEENLEDFEDHSIAIARLAKRRRRYSSSQARRELGLKN